jgi:hypothetical protein
MESVRACASSYESVRVGGVGSTDITLPLQTNVDDSDREVVRVRERERERGL